MKQICTLSLMRVPKEKFPELTNKLIQIVDEHNADTMHIKTTADELKNRSTMLSNIRVVERKHPESPLISALYVRRRDLIAAFVGQTKAAEKAGLPSQTEQLNLMKPFVVRYWKNFYRYNESSINFHTNDMLTEIDGSAELTGAVETLGMKIYLDEIRGIQTTLDSKRDKRRKTRSSAPKMDARWVKAYVGEAITDMLSAIELAVKAYPATDYSAMIAEINQLFTEMQAEIKAHDTRLKNALDNMAKTDTPATGTETKEPAA